MTDQNPRAVYACINLEGDIGAALHRLLACGKP